MVRFTDLWGAARFQPETGADGSAGAESPDAGQNLSLSDEAVEPGVAAPPDEIVLPDDAGADVAAGNGADADQAAATETNQTGGDDGAAQPSQADAAQAVAARAAMVVGQVCGLMTMSPAHKHLFVADLEWALMPPVLLRQFSMVRRNNRLAAFVSWAAVSDEVDARLQQGIARMKPADWRSGNHLWIVDVIAPFGGAEDIVAQVREKVFVGKTVKVLAPGAGWRAASETTAVPAPERGV